MPADSINASLVVLRAHRYHVVKTGLWLFLAAGGLLLSAVMPSAAKQHVPVYPPLQPFIDAATTGARVLPPAGVYAGPLVITRSIELDGRGNVTVDGLGKGSVVTIRSDGVQLRGMRLRNSGQDHNQLDAGIKLRGNFNVIKDNVIEETLFGIEVQRSDHNIIRRNRVRSRQADLSLRGDGIRLWYSFDNKITGNEVDGARDFLILDSGRDKITGNTIRNGRYGLFIVNSDQLTVGSNRFIDNDMGVFALESDDFIVQDNLIAGSRKSFGAALGIKECSYVIIENNRILRNAIGIAVDNSPFEPDTLNRIRHNIIAYNGIGMSFVMDRPGNELEGNWFKGNLIQVAGLGGATAVSSNWYSNLWDDYQGFDHDGDRIGDTPYERWIYSDRIWMDIPMARFFKGSFSLELLDFIERLAPFSEPLLMLRDERPLYATSMDDIPSHEHADTLDRVKIQK